MPIAGLLAKAGLTAGLAALVLRGCAPAIIDPLEDADELQEAGASDQTTAAIDLPAPDPGPPVVAAADLATFAADDPRAAGALSYRASMLALDGGDLSGALEHLEPAATSGFAPALVAWRRGNLLEQLGRSAEAEATWATIPVESRLWGEAALARARVALNDGRPNGALRILGESGVPRPEGSTGDEPVAAPSLLARADSLRASALRARGAEGDVAAAYRACVRVWTLEGAETTAFAEAQACITELRDQVPAALHPGLTEIVARATALGAVGAKDKVLALLQPEVDKFADADAEIACTGRYELGRALHKKRRYSDSVPILAAAADSCPTGETRIRAHYLWAQGLQRRGRSTEAVAAWTSLADRYPEHSYADDALFHAGGIFADLGDDGEAERAYLAAADRFPDGDMVGAGMWRVAWAALSDDRPTDALPWLERQAAGDPRGDNRGRVLQGRYWLSRTRLDVATDDAGTREALDGLAELARSEPMHWYGVIALWRLAELDAEAARAVVEETRVLRSVLEAAVSEPDGFVVEQEFLDAPGTAEALELLQGGLGDEAVPELLLALGDDAHERWSEETLLFASHLLELAGDPYHSHHVLRLAFRDRWPELVAEQRPLLGHAYPLAFHEPIREVTADYAWPAMTFQGLVREESAFSPAIRSYAGAMGLSQLMWPTARATARKMGVPLSRRSQLSDPKLNLSIGATYFEGLFKRWGGHLPLAIASYNAGPGAVGKWMDARGGYQLDAWVETIPYKQTRLYVKRVTSSWQTYHLLYGDGFPYVPVRTGVVRDAVQTSDPILGAAP